MISQWKHNIFFSFVVNFYNNIHIYVFSIPFNAGISLLILHIGPLSGYILWIFYNTIRPFKAPRTMALVIAAAQTPASILEEYQQRPLLIRKTIANTHRQSNVHAHINAWLLSQKHTHSSFTCRLDFYELSAVINDEGRWPANSHSMTGHTYTHKYIDLWLDP